MDLRRITLAIAVLTLTAGASAQNKGVEWGKYLTVEVGKCQDCHTPRTPEGKLDESKWMKGAGLNIQPIEPVKKWHKDAPDITPSGKLWAKWGEEALVKFMTEGVGPRGTPADPPMSAYKLKKEDARAIIDYLKTLK